MTAPTKPSKAIDKVQHCTTMAEVRARIDALDDILVPLLVERSGYMTQAARIKQSDAQVRDVARIEAIVRRVRAAAQAEGGQPHLIEAIYRGIMEASIAYEHREFARLRAGHASDAATQQTAGSAA
ncbi:chorismate mutase [Acidovorax sp. LjRoot129]|uniref:chorismate mutase n=1 Tax=Acidovorax sp. LjRoot129 TaxID=3342260 RepID=UPI003ECF8D6A